MSQFFRCPHCRHQHDTTDWFEYWAYDGEHWIEDCEKCKEEFTVKVNFTVDYELIKELKT